MQYDIIIIGAGPAGYIAALRAAELGKKVALVEQERAGGVCLNWGCIPTKALIKSASVYHYCTHSEQYGIEMEGTAKPNISKIIARSRAVADTMSRGVEFLLSKQPIERIEGRGHITAPNTVEVNGESYMAHNIIIATGARARNIDAIPVDGKRVITSRHALEMEYIPSSIAVIGSGAIGTELAWFYSTLGSQVTIIEYQPNLMPLEDEETSRTIERSFRKIGIKTMLASEVKRVVATDSGCTIEVEGKKGAQTIETEMVLSAVGIKSNIENLGLEELGIAVERDKIVVDEHYETTAKGIFAVGDIIATPALAHVASAEARKCVEYICGVNPAPIDYSAVPSCIFTNPEVASVGATEQQLKAQGVEYRVGRFQFTASGKATASGERDGFAKLLFDSEDKLLGAHIVGSSVAELIAEPTLALTLGATARDIAHTIHPHPTLCEAIAEASE